MVFGLPSPLAEPGEEGAGLGLMARRRKASGAPRADFSAVVREALAAWLGKRK